jgi:membrane-bound metal-dependent hydrolase YbcI (DUF457 family)
LFSIPVVLIFQNNIQIISGAIVGYTGHLLGDYLTTSGIPITYPKGHPNYKRFHAPITFTTGSKGETAVFIASIAALIYFIIRKVSPF